MKRFEFCYLNHERRPHFAILYEDNILIACEQLLCRSVTGTDLIQTPNGTYFIRGWEEGETISVKKMDEAAGAAATFKLGEIEPQETPEAAPLDLGGLDLSQFAKQ